MTMGAPFFPCDEAPGGSTELESVDFLDKVLPLRISKTPERPLSTQFIPCGTSALCRLNDYRCRLPWPDLPAVRLAGGGILASSLLKCSPEVKYSQAYASFDGAERYVTAPGDLCVCPSPKIRKFDDCPLLLLRTGLAWGTYNLALCQMARNASCTNSSAAI